MKNYLLSLIAILAIGLTACENSDPSSLTPQRLEGLWGISTDEKAAEDGIYDVYFDFKNDGTFGYFEKTKDTYKYHRGVYGTDENHATAEVYIYISYQQYRMFVYEEGIARYIFDSNDRALWKSTRLYPTAVTKKMITLKNAVQGYRLVYLHSVKALPDFWLEEFYAQEVPISTDALTAQWDQVNNFKVSGEEITYTYFYEPEKTGITLKSNGEVGACAFWVQYMWGKLSKSGLLIGYDGISTQSADCSWTLGNDAVTLSCRQYIKYNIDSNGIKFNFATVTPSEPIIAEFPIQELTDYYCILYDKDANQYHSFRKNANSPQQAPQRQAAQQDAQSLYQMSFSPLDAPRTRTVTSEY